MALILFTSLFFLVIVLGYIYLKRRYILTNNDVPDSKPQILFGNVLNSGYLTGKLTMHEIMHDYRRRYGDKFVYWFGSVPWISFCSVEHAQTIFSDRNTFEQSPFFLPNFDLVSPHSIMTLSGEKWKRHIRVILPAFKRANIMQYIDTIIGCTDRFIDQSLIDKQVHTDLINRCQRLTTNIIGFIAFDYDLESEVGSALQTVLKDFIYYAAFIMKYAWLPRWLIKLYLKLNSRYQRTHRFLYELAEKIVQQEQNNKNSMEQERSKSVIASLVSSLNEQANDAQLSSGLKQSEMFDEVLVSLMAAFEVTPAVLSWGIFYMSQNPQVQRRIKDELREHDLLMTDDCQYLPLLTQEKLDSLIYCQCVIKEILRLSPATNLTTRIALCDTVVDNVSIRRGQTVNICLHIIGTDKRYWHHGDPMKFIPERFLAEDKNHHPYAMIPFGGGHRACIGQDLAWLELKLIIVRLMQRGVTFEDTPENTGGYEEPMVCYPKNVAVRVRIDRH